jgi:Zn-dependent protease/CBS domain-containing protein
VFSASEYNEAMRGWSILIGRFFGVEVRIHAMLLLLLPVAIVAGPLTGTDGARALGLWFLLLIAVVARETARAVAAAWYGVELGAILLLPTGGLQSFATPEAAEHATKPAIERPMALIGPLASIAFGLLLGAIVLASAPGINLIERPWVAPTHLLRAMVWLNLLLGAINFLPVFPLDGGRIFQRLPAASTAKGKGDAAQAGTASGVDTSLGSGLAANRRWGPSSGPSQWIAIALVVAGLLLGNLWLALMGALVLLGAQMESRFLMAKNGESEGSDPVLMRDVMLTQFSTLSASDTLEDALQRAMHTLQDVFPVVRGGSLVGAVSRQNIMAALASGGNSYVQGVMSRNFQTALPDDSLVKTLPRLRKGQGEPLIPVMEGERIVGIVTPQNLSLSMSLLNQSRRIRHNDDE